MKTRKPSRRNARSRVPLGPWRPRGPLHSSSRAWDVVKHVVPATRQNYLCWHHSAEATFAPHGKNLQDVSAISSTFCNFLEAPGALENGALVYALASFCRNPSCRLRAVGTCAESVAKHGLPAGVGENRPNVSRFLAGCRPPETPPQPVLPSTRRAGLARNPVCRLREIANRCSRLRAEGGVGKTTQCLAFWAWYWGPRGLPRQLSR